MTHMFIELLVWMLGAFFAGCLIGWLLRTLFAQKPATLATATPEPVRAAPPPELPPPVSRREPDHVPVPPIPAMPAAAPIRQERPKGITAPRGGKADNLQRISGVGPKNERVLHNLGFFHFDQIAEWTAAQVEWVDDHLKFNGRIKREEWIRQARLLADGKEAEFLKLYGTGGLKTRGGDTKSGDRTRRG